MEWAERANYFGNALIELVLACYSPDSPIVRPPPSRRSLRYTTFKASTPLIKRHGGLSHPSSHKPIQTHGHRYAHTAEAAQ